MTIVLHRKEHAKNGFSDLSGDYDVNDKQRSGQPKKFEDTKLQALLNENSTQTLQELSAALNVTPMAVFKRLHAMEKIQKEGKWA